MKNLDAEFIRKRKAEVEVIPEGKKYPDPIFPLEWLILCGWDKIAYDEYLTKYTAGTIEKEAVEAFTILYNKMLQILSKIERLASTGHANYNYYKATLEAWAGSGLVSMSKQKHIQDRVNRYKKQQQLQNESGININDIKTV